jgi:3-phosphoshikimate 1-carboxyvinyltransferase
MGVSMSRQVFSAARRLEGELEPPGDKSISHRALIIAAIGTGPCAVTNVSPAEDVTRTVRALTALGAALTTANLPVESYEPLTRTTDSQILVDGRGFEGLRAPKSTLGCGNSGTTMRLLLGVLAGRPFEAALDGDESLRRRPMKRVVEPLRRMGASIDGPAGGDRPPLSIRGGELVGIDVVLEVASAQVKTAIALAGLQAQGPTSIREPIPSRDHTERMLEHFGVPIGWSRSHLVVKSTQIQNVSALRIPGDLSSAAFLLVAAAIRPGSRIRVRSVGTNPTRSGILELLERFGAQISITEHGEESGEPRATVEIAAADRRALAVGPEMIPRTVDELPLVAVLGAVAEGETVVSGASELRVKESDRIAALTAGLGAMGAHIEALPDGFRILGGRPLHGAEVDAAGDHRIAMALAVAALAAEGHTSITGWESVAVSYPGFETDLASLVVPA